MGPEKSGNLISSPNNFFLVFEVIDYLHSSGFGPPFLIEGSKKAQVGRLKASSYCSIWLVNLSHIRSALAPPTLSLNHLQRNLLIDWRRRCGWRPLILLPFASVPKLSILKYLNFEISFFSEFQQIFQNSKNFHFSNFHQNLLTYPLVLWTKHQQRQK